MQSYRGMLMASNIALFLNRLLVGGKAVSVDQDRVVNLVESSPSDADLKDLETALEQVVGHYFFQKKIEPQALFHYIAQATTIGRKLNLW